MFGTTITLQFLSLYFSEKYATSIFRDIKTSEQKVQTFLYYIILYLNYSATASVVILINIVLATSLLLDLRCSSTIKSSRTAAIRRI